MATLVGELDDVSLMTPQPPRTQEAQGVAGVASDTVPRRWRVPQRRSIAMSDHTVQPDSTKPLRGAKGTTDGNEGPGFLSRRGVLRAFGASAAVAGGGGLLEACSSSIKGASSTSTAAGGSSGGKITIGWIHPLTGPLAGFGAPDGFVLSKIKADRKSTRLNS